MKELMTFIRENSLWLHHTLFEYWLIYIDLWSIIHFLCGALVYGILSASNWRNRMKWLLFFVTAFEVVEITIFIAILKMFLPEKAPDVFIDILMGMAGGYGVYLLFEKSKIKFKIKKGIIHVITALVVSYYWTGYYGYELNVERLNSPTLNLFMFIFMACVGFAVIKCFGYLSIKTRKRKLSLGLTYILFFTSVLIVTFIADNVLNIRDLKHQYTMFIFEFLKVNKLVLRMYVLYPIILIALNGWLQHLIIKVQDYRMNRNTVVEADESVANKRVAINS